jgi:hypothetical protein
LAVGLAVGLATSEPEPEPEQPNLTDDLISFANDELVAGCPLATCLFYERYADYARELYQGTVDPLPFDDVDVIITQDMGISSIDDEYHP